MKRLAAALVLVAALARADDVPVPAPVEVHAHAEPATVTIGTRFRYVVEVVSVAGAEVVVEQPTERLGDFEILDFGVEPAVQRDGKTVLTRWYKLVGWEVGHHLVKSPPAHYRVAGGELTDAPGEDIGVTVESVLAQTPDATDVRDIKAPEPVPVDWRPYWLVAAALVLLAVAGAVVWRIRTRPARAGAALPPRLPHELAAEALAELRRRNLVAQGAFKEYYSTLSGIVRTYLEQRFRLRAPEMTTEEFLLTTAREGRLDTGHRRLLGEFLAESDLVKFARHLPTIADSERAWSAAQRFVDETAAVPSAEPERRRAAG